MGAGRVGNRSRLWTGRCQQESARSPVEEANPNDLPFVVDCSGLGEYPTGTGRDQKVEVAHTPVLVEEGMRFLSAQLRAAYHFPVRVDAVGIAVHARLQGAQ